jgi:hypothetical protein
MLLTFVLFVVFWSGNALALRVVVISDLNSSYGSTHYNTDVDRAIARIIELKPDLVLSTGDMVAGQRPGRHFKRAKLEAMWNSFHRHVSEPLARAGIPLAVTPGNHDASVYASFSLERQVYREQWAGRLPVVDFVDLSGYPFQYAFAMAGTLFVSVDATRPGALSEQQMGWLDELLSKQGGRYDYRVLFSHLPLWPVAQRRETEIIADPALEALLQRTGVDLYLNGHHHAFYPGYRSGIAYVSQACLGGGARRLIGSTERSKRSFTLIDFDADQASVWAYTGPDFKRPMDIRDLPKRLATAEVDLVRIDLAPSSYSRVSAPITTSHYAEVEIGHDHPAAKAD